MDTKKNLLKKAEGLRQNLSLVGLFDLVLSLIELLPDDDITFTEGSVAKPSVDENVGLKKKGKR